MATSAMDRRFEIAGQQLKRQESEREQLEKEALRRRFAATGSLGSGASIKAEQLAGEGASKRLAQGAQQIEIAKLGEQARQEDIQGQRAFQSSEREAGQTFAGGQAQLGREFATSERIGGQTFASGERQAGQTFAGEQRQLSADEGRDLALELQRRKDVMAQKGLDFQEKEFKINELVSLFNMGGTEGQAARSRLANMLGLLYGSTGVQLNEGNQTNTGADLGVFG